MDSTLRISSVLRDRIIAAAAASREEVCGLLLGQGDAVAETVACRNVHPHPATHFEIDPSALIAALRSARAGGPQVLGWYHSHPSGDPTPSLRDASDAAPDRRYWLISDGTTLSAWRAVRDGSVHGRFDPVSLAIE